VRSSVKPTEVKSVATRRADDLRHLSFAEIEALPERQDQTEFIRGKEIATATYRDTLADGRIRIVVQAYHNRFLGIGTMTADGFIIAPDGTRTAIPEDMMWEFV
jgi:hypothetical protein